MNFMWVSVPTDRPGYMLLWGSGANFSLHKYVTNYFGSSIKVKHISYLVSPVFSRDRAQLYSSTVKSVATFLLKMATYVTSCAVRW